MINQVQETNEHQLPVKFLAKIINDYVIGIETVELFSETEDEARIELKRKHPYAIICVIKEYKGN